jgi:Cu-Zn family superoxide dismutase
MLARIFGIFGILYMGVGTGCREARVDTSGVDQAARPEHLVARARLQPAAGQDVQGEVLFRETDQGVRVQVVAHGLTPGQHGFHVHEIGDCSAPDFESAGAHFDPAGKPHGEPSSDSHAGDLGNVEADSKGTVETVMMARHVELDPGQRSIVGKAIVIHAQPDDLASQPSGNAGARVACGVIELEDHGS